MRILMVPVADRPECIAALKVSFQLARSLNANIHAVHVRPHRYSSVALPPEASFAISGAALEKAASAVKKSADKHSSAARVMLEEIAKGAGFEIQKKLKGNSENAIIWTEHVGYVRSMMDVVAPFADLVVVTRPRRKASNIAREFMQSALLHSSRPVLILPNKSARIIGKRVTIAWDRTHEAMRAVVCSLPVLKLAEEVSIITSGAGKPDGPKTKPLQNYLEAWNIKTTVSSTRGANVDAVDDITRHIGETKSDLLVMGSYSRNRLRERVFGGVTHYMLHHADIPLLTVHK